MSGDTSETYLFPAYGRYGFLFWSDFALETIAIESSSLLTLGTSNCCTDVVLSTEGAFYLIDVGLKDLTDL